MESILEGTFEMRVVMSGRYCDGVATGREIILGVMTRRSGMRGVVTEVVI